MTGWRKKQIEGEKRMNVLQQALEALECALSDDKAYIDKSKKAITALRKALEQEPVAWIIESTEYNSEGTRPILREIDFYQEVVDQLPAGTKLYTHPQPKE